MSIETSQASKLSSPPIAARPVPPEKPDCGICFETGHQYVAMTEKGHIFCLDCMNRWFEVGKNKTRPSDCPSCREPLKNVRIYKKIKGSWALQGKISAPYIRGHQQHHAHPVQQSERARQEALRSAYGSPEERQPEVYVSAAEMRSMRAQLARSAQGAEVEDAETNRNANIGLGIITTIAVGALALGSMLFRRSS